MKTCLNCYYCNDSFQYAGDWWCACSNPGRSVEAHFKKQFLGSPVLKNGLDLPCWISDSPSNNRLKNPDFSNLAVISPKKKLKRVNRLSRFYPKRNVTVPWTYVLRSKIVNLFTKKETSR
ncbi:MAG: hypothetical protein ACXABX_05095 [Candidatus Thorarchaeota archaeon]|jgi:hypothetical protein